MSIAFYTQELSSGDLNDKIFNCLNDAVDNNKTDDVSLFVNNINYMDQPIKFGVFNATELWNYTGLLISTNIETAYFAKDIVNKFTHVFYAGNIGNNILAYINIVNLIASFVINEDEQKEVKRITGKTLPILELDASKILKEFVNE